MSGIICSRGGTRYGCDSQSGGTIHSATDGLEGLFLRGDHPWHDRTSQASKNINEMNTDHLLVITYQVMTVTSNGCHLDLQIDNANINYFSRLM